MEDGVKNEKISGDENYSTQILGESTQIHVNSTQIKSTCLHISYPTQLSPFIKFECDRRFSSKSGNALTSKLRKTSNKFEIKFLRLNPLKSELNQLKKIYLISDCSEEHFLTLRLTSEV